MANVRNGVAGVRPSNRQLRVLAGVLAYVVAALHLLHPDIGVPRLVLIFDAGIALLQYDPRPLAFVLSGLILVFGVNLGLVGYPRKPLYVGGMALVATFFLGYFLWHLTGHGGFLPVREPLFHGMTPLEAVLAHLSTDLWAATAKLAEAALLATLAMLYRREF
ncbi:hypothetical protein BRC81_12040 [Halobacteriales archaeon QS_1_68_20]|nr:MAG: hypothetical protein BRC81_12040 [Halobacteriales archaeon QS_1_68_20]